MNDNAKKEGRRQPVRSLNESGEGMAPLEGGGSRKGGGGACEGVVEPVDTPGRTLELSTTPPPLPAARWVGWARPHARPAFPLALNWLPQRTCSFSFRFPIRHNPPTKSSTLQARSILFPSVTIPDTNPTQDLSAFSSGLFTFP